MLENEIKATFINGKEVIYTTNLLLDLCNDLEVLTIKDYKNRDFITKNSIKLVKVGCILSDLKNNFYQVVEEKDNKKTVLNLTTGELCDYKPDGFISALIVQHTTL